MARETFWNNREQAQRLIDEAGSLRKKIEPLLKAERQLEDFRVMIVLAEAEPELEQLKHRQELDLDFARFARELDALELAILLGSPHDKSNCILGINAGAGGTEAKEVRTATRSKRQCASPTCRRAWWRLRKPSARRCRIKPRR